MRVTKLTQQRNVHVQVPHGAENQSLTEKLLCRSRLLGFEADVCASVESDIIKSRWPQVSMLRVVTGNELAVSILKPQRLLHPNNSSCSFILSPKDWMCRRAEQTERETGWQVNTNYWQHLLQKTTWNQPLFFTFLAPFVKPNHISKDRTRNRLLLSLTRLLIYGSQLMVWSSWAHQQLRVSSLLIRFHNFYFKNWQFESYSC